MGTALPCSWMGDAEQQSTNAHTESPYFSVIVPTWNRAALLPECLESVQAQERVPGGHEIVVVDDGSTDATADVVNAAATRVPDPTLRYVAVPHGGLNKARNAGIRAARGEIVCFVDDDEMPPPEYLERVRRLLDEQPGAAGVGGPVLQRGRARARTCAQHSIGDSRVDMESAGVAPRLLGGNMAIRAQAFREVGLFDDDLSGRNDEVEWFLRSGLTFYYDPELMIWHRRDHLGLFALCLVGFRQGRSIPVWARKTGRRYRPRVKTIGRSAFHGLRHRCARGWLRAARETGAAVEWARLGVVRRVTR